MSMRYPGGLIATTPVNQQYPSGVWTGPQTTPYQTNNVWANDSSFKNTTLLLHGDGATTSFVKDASTNNFQLTLAGDTKPNNLTPFVENGYWSNYLPNTTGTCLRFGTSSNLALGSGSFTVEMWVYISALASAGYSTLLDWRTNGNTPANIPLLGDGNNNGKLTFVYGTGGGFTQVLESSTTMPLNAWTHIALVRNGTAVTLYFNGTSVATATNSINFGNETLSLGQPQTTGPYTPSAFFSNVRIVKGSAVYTGAFTPPTSPLTAITNTQLLTCQSNRFVDNSTNAFAVTANVSPSVSMQQPFTAPSGTSQYGSGYFNGSTDYLQVSYNSALDASTGPFTYEAWLNPSTTTNKQYLGGSVTNAFFAFVGSGTIFVGRNNVAVDFTSSSAIVINQWNHVVIVRNASNNIAIFINGTRQYYAASNTNNYGLASNPLRIGVATTGSSYEYNGYISNVLIAKSALYDPTASTITVPTAPLTAGSAGLLTLQTNGPENNNGFLDSSLNSFPIARNGNTTQGSFTPYGTGWSNYFDGSGDYLTTASNAALQAGTGAFTLEGWINITGTTSGSILSQLPDVNGGYGVGLNYYSVTDILYADIATTSTSAWRASITPLKNTWYHVALVRDASTNVALFINGTKITPSTGGSTNTTNINTGTTFVSGAFFYDNPTRANFQLGGYVSNARFVKGSAVYDPTQSSITVPTTPLTAVSGTSLLTCQANRLIDSSSNAFAITKTGDVSVQRFNPFVPTQQNSPNVIGGSGYFDGSGDYLSFTGGSATSLAADFTIEAWVYCNTFSVDAAILSIGKYNSNGGLFYIDTSGRLSFYRNSSRLYTGSGSFLLKTWNHVVFVRQGTTFTGYINGVSQGSITFSATVAESGGVGTYVSDGYATSGLAGHYINGYLSNLRLVNGTAIYTTAFTPPTAPLTPVTNTQLLLSTNNAAIFDNSGMSNLETVGNAQIDTSVVKYGTGSMYFDGSGDILSAPASQNFVFGGDLTIEGWVYINSSMASSRPDSLKIFIFAGWNTGNTPQFYVVGTTSTPGTGLGYYDGTNDYQVAVTIPKDQWVHLAYVRSGAVISGFVNGVRYTITSSYSSTIGSANTFVVGGNPNQASAYYSYLNGYIDDLRVTKGVARYVTNFTPPVARMPNQ